MVSVSPQTIPFVSLSHSGRLAVSRLCFPSLASSSPDTPSGSSRRKRFSCKRSQPPATEINEAQDSGPELSYKTECGGAPDKKPRLNGVVSDETVLIKQEPVCQQAKNSFLVPRSDRKSVSEKCTMSRPRSRESRNNGLKEESVKHTRLATKERNFVLPHAVK